MMSELRVPKLFLLVAAFLLVVIAPPEAGAQGMRRSVTQGVTLRDNPYRNSGGSCVYDRLGKLVHSPKGKECPAEEGGSVTDGDHEHSKSQLYDRHPLTEAQRDAQELLKDHSRIAQEIRMLRQSIDDERRKASLARLEKIQDDLAVHLVREEKLLRSIR